MSSESTVSPRAASSLRLGILSLLLSAFTGLRWISKEVSEATLRAAITRNGGEILGEDW